MTDKICHFSGKVTQDYVNYITRVCYGYRSQLGRTVIIGKNLKFLRNSYGTLTGIIPQSLLVAKTGLMDDAIMITNSVEDCVRFLSMLLNLPTRLEKN